MGLKRETDVMVVGAGPVGLFAALSLAERGVRVQVVDKGWRGSMHSYALALHPASLCLLGEYRVVGDLLNQGNRVERIAIFDGDDEVGALDLSALDGPFPFVLVVPQSALEIALEKRLKQAGVKVFWNHQAMALESGNEEVRTRVARMEKYSMGYPVAHTEWMIAKEFSIKSGFLVGADGYHSFIRNHLDSRFEHQGEAETFSVFEFPAQLKSRHEARVVFRNGSTNVVWPLSDDRARWSFQVDEAPEAPPAVGSLQEFVRTRAPWFQPPQAIHWSTTVMFERRLVDRFGRGRIWLVGDAAHITGPVGSQSMNVGLREAHDLAERFSSILEGGAGPEALEDYQAERLAEWRRLLGVEGGIEFREGSPDWIHEKVKRILPCVPASGEEMRRLLEQLGVELS